MKSCILIAITLCLFGCSNEGPNPVGERSPDSTVHLAGIAGVVYAAGMINDEAVYWKDGDVINLSTSVANSIAYSISVLGTDVYVAGREDKYPAVWKNGLKQIIPNQDKQGEIKAVVAVSN